MNGDTQQAAIDAAERFEDRCREASHKAYTAYRRVQEMESQAIDKRRTKRVLRTRGF